VRAVVDIGSNSVLLLVGEVDVHSGTVEVVCDEARITGLGRGVAASGRLDPAAVTRTLEVLEEYRRIADRHGAELAAVATEGLRMASDPEPFLTAAAARLGCTVERISGDREAELSYLSVACEQPEDEPLCVIDIGGGSTELVSGVGRRMTARVSHPIGSVRLTERCIRHDPVASDEIAAVYAAARDAFAERPVSAQPVLFGVAGTITTAAALLLGLRAYDRERVHGSRFERPAIERLRDALAARTIAERLALPCLPPGRADVIVAGLTIALAGMDHCRATTLAVADRGHRYALIRMMQPPRPRPSR